MAEFAEAFGEPSTRASEVEDSFWRRVAQHLEQHGVRGALALFEVVLVARRDPSVGTEPHSVQAVDDDVTDDIARVLHPVYVADLVAVIGRDRDLDDPLAAIEELDDDLGVKVKSVPVVNEWEFRKGRHVVCAVSGMDFTQVRPEQRILDTREDAVAEPLVRGHTA